MSTRSAQFIACTIAVFIFAGCATHRKDYTGGKANVCELHHQQMQKTIIPIYYGLMPVRPRDAAMYSASTNGFPHAMDSLNPGCGVRSAREAVIYTCPVCVRARHQWEADYDSSH